MKFLRVSAHVLACVTGFACSNSPPTINVQPTPITVDVPSPSSTAPSTPDDLDASVDAGATSGRIVVTGEITTDVVDGGSAACSWDYEYAGKWSDEPGDLSWQASAMRAEAPQTIMLADGTFATRLKLWMRGPVNRWTDPSHGASREEHYWTFDMTTTPATSPGDSFPIGIPVAVDFGFELDNFDWTCSADGTATMESGGGEGDDDDPPPLATLTVTRLDATGITATFAQTSPETETLTFDVDFGPDPTVTPKACCL